MRTSFTVLMTFLISGTIWTQEIHTQSNAASLNNEADATLGWTGGAVISTSDTDVQHGSFSMTITSSGQTSGRNAEYSFSVTSGQVYSITIWAKRAPQSYLPAFANWTGFSNFSERAISTTNWTAYNFELTANSNTAIIRVYTSPINRGDTAGDGVLIDAVSITPLISDDQAPTAITDLVAGSTTSTTTTLSWSASTDNVAVVDYELFQDGVSIGLSGGNTSFNVTNLTPDTSYSFTAVAIDGAGNTSAVSNTVNVNTPNTADTEAPTAITDLVAGSTTSTTTTLSWSASTDNVAVVDYELFQDGVSIGLSGGNTSFNVTNLTPDTSYSFTAVAIDGAGNTSAVSNTVNVNTPNTADTEAPTAITDLVAGSTTSTTTTLSWSASTDNVAVVDYELFQDGVSIGLSGGNTSFNVTNLTPDTSYSFTAVAIDGAGNTSAVSNTVNVNTPNTADTEAPTAITDLVAGSTTSTTTTLSWSASTDNVAVVDYELFQDGVSIGLSGGNTSFNVTNLTPDTSYSFTAVAIDGAGNTSAVSNAVNVNTPNTADTEAPTAITDLVAGSTTSTTTTLSWSASTDNVAVVDYELFQDGVSIGLSEGNTSFNVTNLTPDTSYSFTAVAIDGAGNTSAVSNTVNITTSESPTGGITYYTSENSNLGTVDWQANNLLAQGNVGIGTSINPSYRLAVAGNIVAEEVRVALQANWPDYVFENNYQLPSLAVVEQHIKSKKHLINIPSALEIEKHGIALGDMDAKLLRKIEELTLYAIEQEKQIQKLREQNELISELLFRVKALELKLNKN